MNGYVVRKFFGVLPRSGGGSIFYHGLNGQKSIVEKLWLDFFSQPSQWWDNRLEKGNARYPDFKHKKTQEGLWLDSKFRPSWVEAKLAAMVAGTCQSDITSWNSRLARSVKTGQYEKTLSLFEHMQQEGVKPNQFTFVPILNACASLRNLGEGRCIHSQIMRSGYHSDVYVGSSLVDMYVKCGSIKDALRVFNKLPTRNVISWNVIILGHVKFGQGRKALELYQHMQQEGVKPDTGTFVGALNACTSVAALDEGRRVHKQIIQSKCESHVMVSISLVDMYAKCGNIEDALQVFNKAHRHDVVLWNVMIMGHVKCGQGQMALELFKRMQIQGVEPNTGTFVGMLNACASVGTLGEGRCVHEQIIKRGLESDVFVGNSLVDMYAKCGSIMDAVTVFNRMPTRNVVSWTAMLGGYALHGHSREALAHFEQMSQEGVDMNAVSFVLLLSACSHTGLVDEGLHFSESMRAVYNVSPTVKHYACIIDLLGRAGRLHEAEGILEAMSCEPNSAVWMSLLAACKSHFNMEMAEHMAKKALELDPENGAGYVLLSNIYIGTNKQDSSAEVKGQSLQGGLKQQSQQTWIEVHNEVHSFAANDQKHPQIIEICAELERLIIDIKEIGYVPNSSVVLHDMEDRQKLCQLCHHSEKLALAFGLIKTPPSTPLHIFTNFRLCMDCHTVTRFIAKVVHREIVVRDASRFHQFVDGHCSCMDCW